MSYRRPSLVVWVPLCAALCVTPLQAAPLPAVPAEQPGQIWTLDSPGGTLRATVLLDAAEQGPSSAA